MILFFNNYSISDIKKKLNILRLITQFHINNIPGNGRFGLFLGFALSICGREFRCCFSGVDCAGTLILSFSCVLLLVLILGLYSVAISPSGISLMISGFETFLRMGCRGELGKQSVKSAAEPKIRHYKSD